MGGITIDQILAYLKQCLLSIDGVKVINKHESKNSINVDITVKSAEYVQPIINTIEANMYTRYNMNNRNVFHINNGKLAIQFADSARLNVVVHC